MEVEATSRLKTEDDELRVPIEVRHKLLYEVLRRDG